MENVNVQSGDFVSLVKVVNNNSEILDSRTQSIEKGCKAAFNLVEKDIKYLNDRVNAHSKSLKYAGKSLKWFGLGMMMSSITMWMLDKRVSRLEKKVKELEDEKVVDDFMTKKEEGQFDFLK